MWFCHTLFLAGLPFGRVIGWIGQVRDDHTVPWSQALQQLWPHTALGVGCARASSPPPIRARFPMRCCSPAGPRCRSRSRWSPRGPRVGRALTRIGIGRLPEETAPPLALTALALPAVTAASAAGLAPCWKALRTARGVMRSLGIYYGWHQRRRRGDGPALSAVRQAAAIWCSTSAPMSATASPHFAGSAPGWSRSSRSRRWRSTLTHALRPRPQRRHRARRRSAATPATIALMINVDNPTISTASDAFVDAAHGRARLGGPASGTSRSACR